METRTVETIRTIAASPSRVTEAFMAHDDLRGWWKVSRSLVERRVGGVWAIAWDHYGEAATHHAWTGMVRDLDDGRIVVAPLVQNEGHERPLFGPFALEIVAAAEAGGSRLTVRHHGYQHGEHWDWLHDAVVRGWREVLDELASWLAPKAR